MVKDNSLYGYNLTNEKKKNIISKSVILIDKTLSIILG